MLFNFLKISLRKIAKNKLHSAISIVGLALGITSCLFIALYISDELSYDSHHQKIDRIVRLNNILDLNGAIHTAVTDLPTAPTLKNDYPEVENFVRFFPAGGANGAEISHDGKVIPLTSTWFTDSSIFEVFTYEITQGDKTSPLHAPKSVALNESSAKLYFGEENPIGKQLKLNNSFLTVTAVYKDQPSNSEIAPNALISLNTLPQQFHQTYNADWFRIGFYTFLLFKDKPNVEEFEKKLVEFEKKYVQPWAESASVKAGFTFFITPLAQVHFEDNLQYDLPKGNKNYITIFALLAIFILIIASINYINLSLAQSNQRAKEVGVRKTLGAQRKEIINQFIGESVLIAIIASILGLAFIELFLGTFNSITGKALTTAVIFTPANFVLLGLLIVFVGVIAGSYPALVISSIKPITALKGLFNSNSQQKSTLFGSVQSVLIFVQFVFSIFMITGTILINNQMEFMRSMNLGFDKENVLSIRIPSDTTVGKQIPAWVEELRNESQIQGVSLTNMPTGQTGKLMFRIEQEGLLKEKTIPFIFVDEHFIDVLGLDVIEGRNFEKSRPTDARQAFIINKTAAEQYGWQNEALDKRMQWGLLANNQAQNDGKVVGIVNDFHFNSLHNALEPLVLCFNPRGSNTLSIRLSASDYTSTIKKLEAHWNKIAPNHPFNFTFLDDAIDRNYTQEQALGKLFNYFALIAILIASLGLFALVSFVIQRRTKEIGIRKVLGASLSTLSWVLMKDFFMLLAIAFVITIPANILLNNYWLESFAYDAPFSALSFVFALIITFSLAIISVLHHIYTISKADPVEALRYE